jgi:hypothetical protein
MEHVTSMKSRRDKKRIIQIIFQDPTTGYMRVYPLNEKRKLVHPFGTRRRHINAQPPFPANPCIRTSEATQPPPSQITSESQLWSALFTNPMDSQAPDMDVFLQVLTTRTSFDSEWTHRVENGS